MSGLWHGSDWNARVNQAWIVVGNRDHLHEVMYMVRIVYAPLRSHGGKGIEKCVVLRI